MTVHMGDVTQGVALGDGYVIQRYVVTGASPTNQRWVRWRLYLNGVQVDDCTHYYPLRWAALRDDYRKSGAR